MKIGFIGCGNMAKAIINGIIKSRFCDSREIFASANNFEKLKSFSLTNGINAVCDNASVVKKSDIIILCVKPQKFDEILPQIKNFIDDKLVISIAAAKTIEYIQKHIGNKKIIRVMPNLNASISMSQSALCSNELCSEKDTENAKKIFESIGDVYLIDENDFSAFSACACCSPAFSFMYINALADAAQELGLDKDLALKCAIGSVIGSAKMLENSDTGAEELINKVCSPGGTTIEGVKALRQNGFEEAIKKAVNASYNKDKTL